MNRFIAIAILLMFSAACAPRAALVRAPALAEDAAIQSVFVATTRAIGSDGQLGGARDASPRFMRLDISVPPDRELGSLEWPGREISPDTDFLAAAADLQGSEAEFRATLGDALRDAPARDMVIYVHGFNNNFADGVLRIAQLMHDFRLPGVAVHYSWPSAANPLGYVHDRDSVLFARDGLEGLIETVEAAGAGRIILVAHSLGALLTMETLRQMAIARPGSVSKRIGGVILVSPDLDVDVFRRQADRIGALPQPFGIFVSQRDRALALSARLSGVQNRLGNISEVSQVADLDVTLIDVTSFSQGLGHFTVGTSPLVISLFKRAGDIDTAFSGDAAGQSGLIPGTVLTVQNATEIILSPVTALTGQ